MDIAYSINDIPIRLTRERWFHITENHDDLAGYYDAVLNVVEDPDYIIEGYKEAYMALREMGKGKFLAVIYREIDRKDGFIITAYFTRKIKLKKESILWQRS